MIELTKLHASLLVSRYGTAATSVAAVVEDGFLACDTHAFWMNFTSRTWHVLCSLEWLRDARFLPRSDGEIRLHVLGRTPRGDVLELLKDLDGRNGWRAAVGDMARRAA